MPRNYRFVQDLVALAGGEFVSKVIGFAAFAYLARALEPDAYGALELAFALLVFFGLVIDFGLGPIGARDVARDRRDAARLSAQIPSVRLALTFVVVPVMAAIGVAIGGDRERVWLVWLFALSLFTRAGVQQWLFQGLEKMVWVSAGQVIRMSVFALGVVLFVRGPEDLLVTGAVEIAAAVSLAAYFLGAQRAMVGPVRLSFDLPALRALFARGSSVGMSQIVWTFTQYVPTMLLGFFHGGTEIAWFGAAHRIVMALGTFSFLYHFNIFPAVAKRLLEGRAAFDDLVRPSFRVTTWAGVALGVVGMLVAEPLCTLVYGDAFRAAGPPLVALVWVPAATLLYGHARSTLIARDRQRYLLVAQSTGAATALAVGLFAVPRWGALGAAAAMLGSNVVVWGVAQLLTTREVVPLPFLAPLVRPLAVGGAVLLACEALDVSGFARGLAGAALLVLAAPLVDRSLLSDLRTLAHAKADGPPPSGAPVSDR